MAEGIDRKEDPLQETVLVLFVIKLDIGLEIVRKRTTILKEALLENVSFVVNLAIFQNIALRMKTLCRLKPATTVENKDILPDFANVVQDQEVIVDVVEMIVIMTEAMIVEMIEAMTEEDQILEPAITVSKPGTWPNFVEMIEWKGVGVMVDVVVAMREKPVIIVDH
jgi:hypothetical protein